MERYDRAIRSAVINSVENMLFIEVLPGDEQRSPPNEPDRLTVSILIHAPVLGELRLSMPESLATRITAAAYCLPAKEVTDEMRSDTLAEIINIIAGRFLNEILDDDQSFQLGLPQIESGPSIDQGVEQQKWTFLSDADAFTVVAIGSDLLRR